MVEGAPLLREYTGNGIEGSNPFVSAIKAICFVFCHVVTLKDRNTSHQKTAIPPIKLVLCAGECSERFAMGVHAFRTPGHYEDILSKLDIYRNYVLNYDRI